MSVVPGPVVLMLGIVVTAIIMAGLGMLIERTEAKDSEGLTADDVEHEDPLVREAAARAFRTNRPVVMYRDEHGNPIFKELP